MRERKRKRKRTKVEMERLDIKIRPLYERGMGCRIIGNCLNENPVVILRRVRLMGIVRSQEQIKEVEKPDLTELPFTDAPSKKQLRSAAIGVAIQWFMERGHMVSIPIEPAKYDLIVDSNEDLKRIQVKTTTIKKAGRWQVGILRRQYNSNQTANANGKRQSVPYSPLDIDFFFIVTGSGDKYLIPINVTNGQKHLTLDEKYSNFQIT